MDIRNSQNSKPNVSSELMPLFEAMKAGKEIFKIVCMQSANSRDNPALDHTIEGFRAVAYEVGKLTNSDFVCGYNKEDNKREFWMELVRSFELEGEEAEELDQYQRQHAHLKQEEMAD